MKYTLAVLSIVLSIVQLSAQKYTIEGYIHDESNQAIEVASVVLLNAADSVMAGFSITSAKGRFKIEDIGSGRYSLNISYLGYADYNKPIDITGESKVIDIGIIKLEPETNVLNEVNITEPYIPIKINKDTVEYNAAAFKTQEQDNVEELLKKLPGVEVADDGTITAHGEEVEKVTVDGKEFFTNDPTIATKNLPADAIEKLQVFDESSDMAAFTGIDDGERKKTINLVLKEGKKAGYFGKANLGYGTDERYNGNFNINRFTKDVQMSFIGMSNNVNVQGFSFRDYVSFMGGMGNFSSGGGRGNSSNLPISNGGLGNGFVNTDAIGANFNWDPNKNITTNTSYFYTGIENIIDQDIFRENLLGNSGFTTEQAAILNNVSIGHAINSTIRAELDSTQRLVSRITAKISDGSSLSNSMTSNFRDDGSLQSKSLQDIESVADQSTVNANVTYLKRLSNSGKYFSINGRIGYSSDEGVGALDNANTLAHTPGSFETVNILQSQIQENNQIDYLIKGSYTVPLGGRKYFEANASRRNFNNDFAKDFYDLFPDQQTNEVLNDLLSNTYKRDFTYNTAGFNLKFNTNKSNLTIGANLQQSILDGQLEGNTPAIEKKYVTLLPKLSYTYDINATSNFRANYTTNITEPSLEQLQPIVDNTDPLNIYIGNPDLRTENTHRLRLSYNSFSQFSNIGIFSNVNVRFTDNSITNTRLIDENFVTTTTPINTDYALNISGSVSFNAPIKFLKHRIRISNRFSSNKSFLFINTNENLTNRINNNVTVRLDNWKKDFIDFEIGTSVGYNNTKYSEDTEFNQSFVDYRIFTEIDLDFKKDWTFTTNFSMRTYSDEDFGEQITLPIWRASLSKLFSKEKKWRAELAVFDILDQNQNINRTSNINYIQDERIESIGQYAMITLGYNFSGFGGTQGGFGGGRARR